VPVVSDIEKLIDHEQNDIARRQQEAIVGHYSHRTFPVCDLQHSHSSFRPNHLLYFRITSAGGSSIYTYMLSPTSQAMSGTWRGV
jgi:hypothetical protein